MADDEAPKITDRRASRRGAGGILVPTASQTAAALKGRLPREGVTVPARTERRDGLGPDSEVDEMRRNRRVNQKLSRVQGLMSRTGAGAGGSGNTTGGGADVQFATGRPRDPMFYWRQNNLPYDVTREDELKKIRAFCNTPDAPIWMGDYSFKPIGEVQPGDEVIGWSYSTGDGGQQRKRLVRTKVLATQRRMAPEVVRITMESGRVVRCTPDHLWANYHYSPTHQGQQNRPGRWQQPEYKPAKVGGYLTSFIEPTEPLEGEKERLAAAWLSGIYDGEGSGNEIGQSLSHNPDVYLRIQENLDLLGIPHRDMDDRIRIQAHIGEGPGKRGKAGGQQALVDFLNWTDPVRRVKAHTDRQLLTRPSGGKDKVVSIESEGAGEVVSMQTETGNYVAWGYASKNCRLLYMTHPIVSACIDIFSKFPLQGMDFVCKDEQLTDFHKSLFFDELEYEDFLLDVGREYWLTGESWPLGSWNETLGVWDGDELLNPDDVEVERSPFLKDPRYLIRLPETLRKVLQERSPRWEYEALMKNYPELQAYAAENSLMPVSNILLQQIKFKGDTFHKRGLPILMRGFRSIMQEEMLSAAMDAIADRLYTPLILAKLGASASDLGTEAPWIPTRGDLDDFEEALDAALAGDFRILTHHFAVDMEPVFGRENMPDLTGDFERIEDRILQVFGLSRTILQGADSGETYAADALNRDVVTQLMTHYQRHLKKFYESRALIVAEAQEHFDYDVRNGKRYVKMEEILEVDEESGEERIIEQPKLLIPELKFDTMTLQDEQVEREFLERLNEAGVPIPIKRRLLGTGVDFDESLDERSTEQVQLAVKEQETRRETFKALRDAGMPIPDDLKADFQPKAAQVNPHINDQPASDMPIDTLGVMPPANPALAPTPDQMMNPGVDPNAEAAAAQEPVGPAAMPAQDPMAMAMNGAPSRPPESDEMRATMPKPAHKIARLKKDAIKVGIRRATAENYVGPDNSIEDEHDEDGQVTAMHPENYRPDGKFGPPRHLGMRRHVVIAEDAKVYPDRDDDPVDDQPGEE